MENQKSYSQFDVFGGSNTRYTTSIVLFNVGLSPILLSEIILPL